MSPEPRDYHQTIDHFFFMVSLASSVDDIREHSNRILLETSKDPEERERLEEEAKKSKLAFEKLTSFSYQNSKNITVGFTDSFLWYLSAIIQECAKRKNDILKSNEKISIEDVLSQPSRSELINHIIDRKINDLSYGGLKAIEKFASDALGTELFQSERHRDLTRVLIEARNIHAHNRGFVNRIFIERTEGCNLKLPKLGKRIVLGFDEIGALTSSCIETCKAYDMALAKKFKIQRKRYDTWRKQFSHPTIST